MMVPRSHQACTELKGLVGSGKVKAEPTPATLQKCLNKGPKWIERAGRDSGNYPIYVTSVAGRKILDDAKKARG
jgi:hypothetical protein